MGKKIILTVDERVILHLMDFIPHEEDFEAPDGTTQAGIAKAVGIERKHVPRAVKKLIEQDLLMTRVSHVKGSKQRKKVYFLTFDGKAYARKLWRTLASKEVGIVDGKGEVIKTTFSELCFTHQVGKTPVELLTELDDDNIYDQSKLKNIRKKAEKKTTEKIEKSSEIYRKALTKAWEDQILTRDEDEMLRELRSVLSISEEEHERMQDEILNSTVDPAPMNREGLYQQILSVALKDGVITTDEREILDEMKRLLGLKADSTEEAAPTSDLGGEYRSIYRSVLSESLRDGKITEDEQNIIVLLKKMMGIEDSNHVEIMNEIKGGK